MKTSQQLNGFLYCLEGSANATIKSEHNPLFIRGNYLFFLTPESDPDAIWIEGSAPIHVVETFPGDIEDSGRLKVVEVDLFQADAAYVSVEINQ